MSWHPTGRNGLQFVAKEFWPGGGEDGDGRDLTGVAKYASVWREETTDADLIAEALHPSDAEYFDRVGEFDRELETLDVDQNGSICVNGVPLEVALAEGDFDELSPEDEEIDREHIAYTEYADVSGHDEWNDEPDADEIVAILSFTNEAGRALAASERDGRLMIGSRRAAHLAHGWDAFQRPINSWRGAPNTWKHHRRSQYRPDQKPQSL